MNLHLVNGFCINVTRAVWDARDQKAPAFVRITDIHDKEWDLRWDGIIAVEYCK